MSWWGTFARFMHAPDYPLGATPEFLEYLCGPALDTWGEATNLGRFCPSLAGDKGEVRFQGELERLSATPSTMRALWRMNESIDVRDILTNIQVDPRAAPQGRHRPDRARPADRREHPGGADRGAPRARPLPWIGDADSVIDEIEEFLTGQRHDAVDVDRVLATVVFTDIVESTRAAEHLGARRGAACSTSTIPSSSGSSNALEDVR